MFFSVFFCWPLHFQIAVGKETNESSADAYLHFILGSFASLDNNSQSALEHFKTAAQLDPQSSLLKLKQAEEHLSLSHITETKSLLTSIQNQEKKNPDYHLLVAKVASQESDLRTATKALDQATKLYFASNNTSKGRESLLTKVAILADHRRYSESVMTLNSYLKKEPNDEIGFYFLGKIHSIFQNRKESKKAFQKALDLRPGFGAAAKALGLQLELEGNAQQAIAVYQQALSTNGADEEIIQKLINLSLISENYPMALVYLNQFLTIRPEDTQSQMRAALIYYKLKDFTESQKIFQGMLNNDSVPQDRILFYLGTLCEEDNRFADGLKYYEKVDAKSEYFIESRLQIGLILESKLNKADLASLSLAEGISLRPDAPELVIALAAFHDRQDQLPEAIRVLTKGSATFKQNEKILFMLGHFLDRTGDFEAGVDKMKQVLKANPNNEHALNHIGYTYAEHNINLEQAESYLKQAVQIAPENGFIQDSLGWTYYRMGKYKLATELIERANKLSPGQPVILEHLADLYQKLGKREQALEIYQRIMRMSAENENSKAEEKSTAETKAVQDRVKDKMALLDTANSN